MILDELLRRLRYGIRRDQRLADLEDEMRLHRALRAEAMQARGMTEADARAEARRRFGNPTALAEASGDAWGYGVIDRLVQDMRFAARRLRARPGFSLPIIAALALGIGATTAVFSAVDAAMLRSLPFPRAEELVALTEVDVPFESRERSSGRNLDLVDVLSMPDVFANAAAYASGGLNLSDPERPLRVKVGGVSVDFFATLGAAPLQGRVFSAEEGKPDGPLAVVLSYGLWQRQFGGRALVGQPIPLNGRSYPVVGIMPPGFDFPEESDLWIPMSVPTTFATFEPFRGFVPSRVIARLRPNVSLTAARTRMLARWIQVVAPATGDLREVLDEHLDLVRRRTPVIPLQRELLGQSRTALLVLLGATTLLLAIACANVANLLLSDAAVRRREIAVREVLGATRARIVRQLLAESGLLALSGAVIGVLLAPAALVLLRTLMPPEISGVATARVDLRVLAFTATVAMAASVLFGLWPAIGATRGDASMAIKSGGGHGATQGLGASRRGLVIIEVALSIVLLIGGGLMMRSFVRLVGEKTGMDPSHVATMEATFPQTTVSTGRSRIITGVIDRLTGQPGIVAAGAVNDLPLRGGGGIVVTVDVPGAPVPGAGEYPWVRSLFATGAYFDAMGIARVRGRTFTASDATGLPVAIISTTMAERFWPGVDPLGRQFSLRGDTASFTVVGVVADVRDRGLDMAPIPQMYRPMEPGPLNAAIVVRGTLRPRALIARLTSAMHDVAPGQAVFNVRMRTDVVRASVGPRRTNTVLFGVFAALGLMLSALGVYAVVAYGVAQRSRELGIRVALGATGRDLLTLVSQDMIVTLATGVIIGLGAAWGLSRVLASLLYGVDPRDPATFSLVPLALVLPVIVATVIPALRAARTEPTRVMRSD